MYFKLYIYVSFVGHFLAEYNSEVGGQMDRDYREKKVFFRSCKMVIVNQWGYSLSIEIFQDYKQVYAVVMVMGNQYNIWKQG